MNAEIKIRFLKGVNAPQAVYQSRCECCGAFFEGWQDSFFFEGQELDPDEQYNQVDLSKLVLGTDYAIIEFHPETPHCY
jgi:hypothetical protein